MSRKGREYWTGLAQGFERSGLTQKVFAQQQGVPLKTLQRWIYRLRKEPKRAPRWLPVGVIASAAPPPVWAPPPASEPTLEVVLPQGLRLRFTAGTDSTYLAQVVASLQSGTC